MQCSRPELLLHYRKLLRRFGPQGWWPVYRAASYQLQICIGAILTQNTAWRNVEIALERLLSVSPPPRNGGRGSERGRGGSLTPEYIVSLPRRRLASLVRPAGYFNQKAKKLQIFSRWLLKQYDGSIARFFRQPTERCRAELLSLWGIGPETADSMLLYAGRHPVFVIDAYTKRWLKMSEIEFRTYDECQRFFMDHLPQDVALFNEFHALIVTWGKSQKRYQAPLLDPRVPGTVFRV